MEDLVERQAAIDALRMDISIIPYAKAREYVRAAIETIYNRLEELPSAQPEQKVGKWIIKDNPGTGWYRVTCSECGEDVTSEIRLIGFIPNCKALWDYCPYCGAKMEEQDE